MLHPPNRHPKNAHPSPGPSACRPALGLWMERSRTSRKWDRAGCVLLCLARVTQHLVLRSVHVVAGVHVLSFKGSIIFRSVGGPHFVEPPPSARAPYPGASPSILPDRGQVHRGPLRCSPAGRGGGAGPERRPQGAGWSGEVVGAEGCSRALGLPSKVALRVQCTVQGSGFPLGVMAPLSPEPSSEVWRHFGCRGRR